MIGTNVKGSVVDCVLAKPLVASTTSTVVCTEIIVLAIDWSVEVREVVDGTSEAVDSTSVVGIADVVKFMAVDKVGEMVVETDSVVDAAVPVVSGELATSERLVAVVTAVVTKVVSVVISVVVTVVVTAVATASVVSNAGVPVIATVVVTVVVIVSFTVVVVSIIAVVLAIAVITVAPVLVSSPVVV